MWFGNGRIAPVLQVLTIAGAVGGPQLIQRGADAQKRAQTVDPPGSFESFDRLLGNGRAVQQTRVIDQRGHRSEPVDGLRHRLLPLPLQCHIQRNPDHRVIAQAVDRGAQFGGVDVAGRHEKPVGTQSLGDGPALPSGGPGDQRDASTSPVAPGFA